MKTHWSRNLFQRIYATILRDRFRRRAVVRSQRRSRRRSSWTLSRRADWEPLEPRMLLAADVATDKFDYAPGSTALISTFSDGGADHNFLVGETVRFQVVRTDGIADRAPGNLPWQVTDGVGGFAPYTDEAGRRIFPDTDGIADGRIATTWFVDPQYSSAGLQVTATGLVSGEQATELFRDSPVPVVDGSFESPAPSGSGYTTFAGRWENGLYVGPFAGDSGWWGSFYRSYNGSFLLANANGVGVSLTPSPYGTQVGALQGQSDLYQTLNVPVAGTYRVSFIASTSSNMSGSSGVVVSLGGSVVGTWLPGEIGAGSWQTLQTAAITLSAGTHVLKFSGQAPTAIAGPGEVQYNRVTLIDGVAVETVKQAATITVTPFTATYDGLSHGATGSATGAGGLDLTGLLRIPLHTAPGTYTDTWTFDGNDIYAPASGTVTNTILKATASITVNPYAVTYDGQSHAATGSATGVNVVLPGSGTAIVLSTPAGLSNGDKFQFIYVTPTQTPTTSTDIATYNTFVNASVNTGDATYLGKLVQWKALGSTDTVSALQNLGTNPYGIYQSNGTKVANSLDSSGLWSGSGDIIGATMDLAGGGASRPIVSGTNPNSGGMYIGGNGGPLARHTLGNPTYQQLVGNASEGNGGWLAADFGGVLQPGYMYAVSEVLTVGPPARAPENLIGLLRLPAPHAAAGTYTDTWTFDGNSFYEPASGTVTNTIAKAAATISVTGYSGTYDGGSHTAAGTAKGVLGETLAGLDLAATARTNAGTYTSDAWTFTDATGNYENKTGTVTTTIAKATPTISVTGYTGTYDGASHTATGTAKGVLGETLAGLSLAATARTNAGTSTTDAWTFTDSTGNYENKIGTEIGKHTSELQSQR